MHVPGPCTTDHRVYGLSEMSLKLCFVIPNYNGTRHLQYSMRSLEPCTSAQTGTVMVDDASTDKSVQFVESNYPTVIVLRRKRNGGFAAAVNQGIRWAMERGISYVAIFNSDIQVPSGFWQPVVEYLDRHERAEVVGFREVNNGEVELPAAIEFTPAPAVLPGMLYICRTRTIAEQGFFDESYVMYGEESDLFDRITASGGEILQSNIPVWHFVSGSRDKARWRIAWYSYRNIIRHAMKNRSMLGVVRSVAVSAYYAAVVPDHPASQTWLGRRLLGLLDNENSRVSGFARRIHRFNLGNRVLNLAVCACAVAWNAASLPGAIAARVRRRAAYKGSSSDLPSFL